MSFSSLSPNTAATRPGLRWDLWALAVLTALLSLHLVPGLGLEPQGFLPQLASEGEWWRLLTHPFVHVTWYHLLLDGAGFFALYSSLQARRASERLACAAASAAGSLALAALFSPGFASLGLCGLSGTTHGLWAVSGLELVQDRRSDPALRRLGWATLALLSGKCLYELLSGRVLFEFLLFGMAGTPMAACHPGGALGGALAFAALSLLRSRAEATTRAQGSRPNFWSFGAMRNWQ